MEPQPQPNANAMAFSTLLMNANYEFTACSQKTIHLSGATLQGGTSAELWLKKGYQEHVLAVLCAGSSPRIALDIDIQIGDTLYLESNGHVLVSLSGSMPEVSAEVYGTFDLRRCFIIASKGIIVEVVDRRL